LEIIIKGVIFVIEAGFFTRFLEHPGVIIWSFIFVFFQRFLFYKTNTPYTLTFLIAAVIATLFLRILSQDLFENFLGFFTDVIHR
jgi:hypothetical protein